MQTIPWHPAKPDAGGKRKAMMFRRKLLTVFALTVFLSVAAVALLVSAVTRRAFDRSEEERTAALVTQFRREFNRQGESVVRRVEAIAASDEANRMTLKLNRPRRTLSLIFWSLWKAMEPLFLRRNGRQSLAIQKALSLVFRQRLTVAHF